MLEEEDITLKKLIKICPSIEITTGRMQYMSNEKESVPSVQEIIKAYYSNSMFPDQVRGLK